MAPEAEILTRDVYCCECRYNLRSLSVSGQCPECGHPVRASLSPWVLDLASNSRQRLSRGCVVYGISFALWPVTVPWPFVGHDELACVPALVFIAGAIGLWLLARPIHLEVVPQSQEPFRMPLRMLLVPAVALLGVAVIAMQIIGWEEQVATFLVLACILNIAASIAATVYLGELSACLPDSQLEGLCRRFTVTSRRLAMVLPCIILAAVFWSVLLYAAVAALVGGGVFLYGLHVRIVWLMAQRLLPETQRQG